jgi:hypothetical protein
MQQLAVVRRQSLASNATETARSAYAACARQAEELNKRLTALAARTSATPKRISHAVRTRLADFLEDVLHRFSALLPFQD